MLECEICGFESDDLEEVCYYDINGESHCTEDDIERHLQDPDALAHILCSNCAETFNFEEPKDITEFRDKYYFLSNFYKCQIQILDLTFTNAEAAFQSFKNFSKQKSFQKLTASEAKRFGRQVSLRGDWEQEKDGIMYIVVKAKFDQSPYLKAKLIATGSRELIEGNTWHDNYWGSCTCARCKNKGLNMLGKLLMRIRKIYMEE